jgi:hypothetical protein
MLVQAQSAGQPLGVERLTRHLTDLKQARREGTVEVPRHEIPKREYAAWR